MKIVYCWEFGEGLGHITPWASIATKLQEQGHEVLCFLKDTTNADEILSPHGIKWFQGPVPKMNQQSVYPINHAQILANFGYTKHQNLIMLVKSWMQIFELTQPDKVLLDGCYSGAMAADIMGINSAFIGNGFYEPEPADIMPSIRPWDNIPERDFIETEASTLHAINTILKTLNEKPYRAFSDIFNREAVYRTWKEINHFPTKTPKVFFGPTPIVNNNPPPVWPEVQGQRAFAYLKGTHPLTMPLLMAAVHEGFAISAYIPDVPDGAKKMLVDTGRVHIHDTLVNTTDYRKDIQLLLTHGGNTIGEFAPYKTRMFCIPQHGEQRLIASRAVEAGLPLIAVGGRDTKIDILFDRLYAKPFKPVAVMDNALDKVVKHILRI